jgi:hypothetical protein
VFIYHVTRNDDPYEPDSDVGLYETEKLARQDAEKIEARSRINPTEVACYMVEVKSSEDHVPNEPVIVFSFTLPALPPMPRPTTPKRINRTRIPE